MLLPIVLNSMNAIGKERLVNEILEMNDESREFGLVLTPQEAVQILEARNRSLQQLGRIELGIGVSQSIIHGFCNSSYIAPEDYVVTLNELHEIFYYMKNETEDKIGDDQLIKTMKDYFEGSCGGSLDLLKSMLISYAGDFRKKSALSSLMPEED
jgi:hypothetical protein